MTTVRDIESYLFELAPKELAQSWDNVGLLVGEALRPVKKVLVTLDITAQTAREAIDLGCDLIVAHHPVMNCAWHPVQSVRDDNPQGRLLLTLIENHIAAICMHTNLDAAKNGVNGALAETLGLAEAAPVEENGIERVGSLPEPVPLERFLAHVKASLGANGLRYADGGKPVRRVAVGGGACGDFFQQAAALGCDTFVTADVVCPVVIEALRRRFPTLEVVKSRRHREIIQYFA